LEVDMSYVVPKESFNGKVLSVDFGKDDKALVLGGDNALPFLSFDGELPNRPVIAFEVQDCPPDDWPDTVKDVYKDVSGDPVTWAKHCQDNLNAKAIALRLISTHPDRDNRSAEDAAGTIKEVLAAINVPLIILGSNNIEKDASVLVAAAEAASARAGFARAVEALCGPERFSLASCWPSGFRLWCRPKPRTSPPATSSST
jgi:acetyl-CoA decarbonylase/synthase complex subunit delta